MVKRGKVERLQQDDDYHVALLHLALKEDDILAIKDLVRVPHWIEAIDRSGRNAIHWAVAFGTRDACELLLARSGGESVRHADKLGRTPLHFAAIWGRSDLAKLIVSRGADINAGDKKGMTALHYAAQNANPFMLRSLLKRGADKNCRDSRKRSPYQIALLWNNNDEILDLLQTESQPRDKVQKTPGLPQAQRFAASLTPLSDDRPTSAGLIGLNINKDYSAELVKFEMQKQSEKTRSLIRKVIVKRLKKSERTATHAREFALRALATRRRKLFVDQQTNKTREQRSLVVERGVKDTRKGNKQKEITSKTRNNRSRSPSKPSSPYAKKPQVEVSASREGSVPRSESKTPVANFSSASSSPVASKSAGKKYFSPKFPRPNTPDSYIPSPPNRPNPSARHGWPSPPASIRAGKSKKAVENNPTHLKWPVRTLSPARLALKEFVGTSARHNALGKYPSPRSTLA